MPSSSAFRFLESVGVGPKSFNPPITTPEKHFPFQSKEHRASAAFCPFGHGLPIRDDLRNSPFNLVAALSSFEFNYRANTTPKGIELLVK